MSIRNLNSSKIFLCCHSILFRFLLLLYSLECLWLCTRILLFSNFHLSLLEYFLTYRITLSISLTLLKSAFLKSRMAAHLTYWLKSSSKFQLEQVHWIKGNCLGFVDSPYLHWFNGLTLVVTYHWISTNLLPGDFFLEVGEILFLTSMPRIPCIVSNNPQK